MANIFVNILMLSAGMLKGSLAEGRKAKEK